MPIEKLIYTNEKLKFTDVEDVQIDSKDVCNLFNWNTLFKIHYLGQGSFSIIEKINDSPPLIEGEEYILYFEK